MRWQSMESVHTEESAADTTTIITLTRGQYDMTSPRVSMITNNNKNDRSDVP